MLYPTDPLGIAADRARRFQDDAAAERLRRPSRVRHAFASSLRGLADRVEPVAQPAAPLSSARPARQC